MTHHRLSPDVCVVCRTNFGTGLGVWAAGVCEALARSFSICILPTEPSGDPVTLPTGRIVPICKDPQAVKVWFFVDVIWNGIHDFKYTLVPKTGLRIAHTLHDSNGFDDQFVNVLNNHFDVALATNQQLRSELVAAGVSIPVGVLPIAIDLDDILTSALAEPKREGTRFLTIGAFHPRKDHEALVRAFGLAFGDDPSARLRIHSNVAFPGSLERLRQTVRLLGLENVEITYGFLHKHEHIAMLQEHDVYVSCSRGEGCGIGAREALAAGKPVVLSAVGGYIDLRGDPGVHLVEPAYEVPARYPEINNRVYGVQGAIEPADFAKALVEVRRYVTSGNAWGDRQQIRASGARHSIAQLWPAYAQAIDPQEGAFRGTQHMDRCLELPDEVRRVAKTRIGRPPMAAPSRRVTPVHDAGFFSIFNCFVSNLNWDLKDSRVRSSVPDWDVGRLLRRQGAKPPMSFCYGREEDGNVWHHLFEPLFGLSEQEMDDEDELYRGAPPAVVDFNARREPLLTHTNAYKLYLHPNFPRWRREYKATLDRHVHLRPHYQRELDAFWDESGRGRFMVGAHVRHPSHIMEQPGGAMASTRAYIDQIEGYLVSHGVDPKSDGWGLFLASDQDRTIQQFIEAFGERVSYFTDVRRTRREEDERYERLSAQEKVAEGHQVQHLVAANRANWSTRMAWEIVRDAHALSRCRALFHVVSNVSTAVSYINPDIELIYSR